MRGGEREEGEEGEGEGEEGARRMLLLEREVGTRREEGEMTREGD